MKKDRTKIEIIQDRTEIEIIQRKNIDRDSTKKEHRQNRTI